MPPASFQWIKECKGAALAILVLLSANRQMNGEPVAKNWLMRHSGYSAKTISQALAYLSETGRIVLTRFGWELAEGVHLSMMGTSLAPGGQGVRLRHKRSPGSDPHDPRGGGEASGTAASPPGTSSCDDELPVESRDLPPAERQPPQPGREQPGHSPSEPLNRHTRHSKRRRNFSDPGGRNSASSGRISALRGINSTSIATTTTAMDLNLKSDQAEAEESKKNETIPDRDDLEHIQANLAAFKAWGVGRNEKTILLSAHPEVTPQQIEAVARRLIEERRFSTGLLITAVQCGDQPVPNPRGVRPSARDPSRYAEWEQ